MKTVRVDIDWLNEINGKSVAEAINCLSTLPQDHILNYWQSNGDDQGVEISSGLTYQRPFTEQELAQLAADRKAKKIADCKRSISYYEGKRLYYESAGKTILASSLQHEAELFRQQLKELL